MKPVDQTILHDPANGRFGNCFAACIASLLELPIDQVPPLCTDPNDDTGEWVRSTNAFLALQGLAYMDITRPGAEFFRQWSLHLYHVISGDSPRFPGMLHAVVGLNGEIVHDPHPSRAGLAGDPASWTFGLILMTSRGSVIPFTSCN